jgi:hypothetical protein
LIRGGTTFVWFVVFVVSSDGPGGLSIGNKAGSFHSWTD